MIYNKITQLGNAFLITCFCLIGNITFSQVNFNDQFLKIQEGIATSTDYNSLVSYMKGKNYTFDSKEKDEEDNMEYFVFIGSFKQLVSVAYSKNKKLLFVKSNLLTLNLVFCEMELENKKFNKLSTVNEEYEGEKWVETTWGKTGYPYRFKFERSDEKISWMYLFADAITMEKADDPYDFSSLQEFADVLNAQMVYARINFSNPNYKFSVVGKTDFAKSSFQFVVKNNALYAKMAAWTGQSGGVGPDAFYLTIKYTHACNNHIYKDIFFTLNSPSESFYKKVKAKIEECCWR